MIDFAGGNQHTACPPGNGVIASVRGRRRHGRTLVSSPRIERPKRLVGKCRRLKIVEYDIVRCIARFAQLLQHDSLFAVEVGGVEMRAHEPGPRSP